MKCTLAAICLGLGLMGTTGAASAQDPLAGLLGVLTQGELQATSLVSGLATGTPLAEPVGLLTNLIDVGTDVGLGQIGIGGQGGQLLVTQLLGGQIPPPTLLAFSGLGQNFLTQILAADPVAVLGGLLPPLELRGLNPNTLTSLGGFTLPGLQ